MFEENKNYFINKYAAYILIGVELEFYLENIEKEEEKLFMQLVNNNFKRLNNLTVNLVKENCQFQYEVQVSSNSNIFLLIENINLIKEIIGNIVSYFHAKVNFSSKPYLDMSGNGFHVHINLLNIENNNLFFIIKDKISDYLRYSIGGLCVSMKKNMIYFAPYESSYLRYQYADINTPTTISWGINNRTAAIRLIDPNNRFGCCRIEHRVPGADCNYKSVIVKIIEGIVYGIENQIDPPNRVYGIASDLQYNLEKLPLNIDEAVMCHKKNI